MPPQVVPVAHASAKDDDDFFLNVHKGKSIKYKDKKDEYEAMLWDFMELIDFDNTGELSAENLDEAADIIKIAASAKHNNTAELNYKHMPEAVSTVLSQWDKDKSGSVGISELMMAAEAQKKMKDENRLVKRLLVGAIVVILILLGATFGLSITAAELAKETKADQDTGIVTTASGNPAAMGAAVQRFQLVDLPGLGLEKLKEMRDLGYVHNGAYHYRMLSGFDWHSETKMEITATNGEVLSIDNGVLTLQKPGGQVQTLDLEAGRRLGFSGSVMTSGSFTMMASGGFGRRLDLDPEAVRQLSFQGAMMTSGSFTMMAATSYG